MQNRVVLAPCNRGRNKRGICLHKRTKSAKSAKKQILPSAPRPIQAYQMRFDRA